VQLTIFVKLFLSPTEKYGDIIEKNIDTPFSFNAKAE
jgi:hypothetical protein